MIGLPNKPAPRQDLLAATRRDHTLSNGRFGASARLCHLPTIEPNFEAVSRIAEQTFAKRVCVLASMMLAACDGAGVTPLRSADGSSSTLKSGWTVSSDVDAMADQQVNKASAVLSGSLVDTEVSITCNNDRTNYRFRTFDKAGQPAVMRTQNGRIPGMIRVGTLPPTSLSRIVQATNEYDFFALESDYPAAETITVRFPMLSGEETIRIDQADPGLRPMLDKCAQIIGEQRKEEQALQDRNAAEYKARCGDHACPIPGAIEPTRGLLPPPGFSMMDEGTVVSEDGPGPSFQCAASNSAIEATICSSEELAVADRELGSLYASAVEERKEPYEQRELRKDQRRFLADRDACTTNACVLETYEARLQTLRN